MVQLMRDVENSRLVQFSTIDELEDAARLLIQPLYSDAEIAMIVPNFLRVMQHEGDSLSRLRKIRDTGMRLDTYIPPSETGEDGVIGYINREPHAST